MVVTLPLAKEAEQKKKKMKMTNWQDFKKTWKKLFGKFDFLKEIQATLWSFPDFVCRVLQTIFFSLYLINF